MAAAGIRAMVAGRSIGEALDMYKTKYPHVSIHLGGLQRSPPWLLGGRGQIELVYQALTRTLLLHMVALSLSSLKAMQK